MAETLIALYRSVQLNLQLLGIVYLMRISKIFFFTGCSTFLPKPSDLVVQVQKISSLHVLYRYLCEVVFTSAVVYEVTI